MTLSRGDLVAKINHNGDPVKGEAMTVFEVLYYTPQDLVKRPYAGEEEIEWKDEQIQVVVLKLVK